MNENTLHWIEKLRQEGKIVAIRVTLTGYYVAVAESLDHPMTVLSQASTFEEACRVAAEKMP